MAQGFSVSLNRIVKEFALEDVYVPENIDEIVVSTADLNRPGLQLGGFYDYFDSDRIQIIGKNEDSFLRTFIDMETRIDRFLSQKPPALVITRGLDVSEHAIKSAEKYGVPILRTQESTSAFMAALIAFLSVELAPRITRHGVLVEVYGEGMLIIGESGVGKSETAIELIKRGHRLIADDAVEIRRVSNKTLVGAPPENIRHFIELRGIGIINARRIFGMGAVKPSEKIDMVINLEIWDQNKVYDRMGIESEEAEILGLKVPQVTVPVRPGRNLAIILEVAAMNNRQKKMGFNAAKELLRRLGMDDDSMDGTPVVQDDFSGY